MSPAAQRIRELFTVPLKSLATTPAYSEARILREDGTLIRTVSTEEIRAHRAKNAVLYENVPRVEPSAPSRWSLVPAKRRTKAHLSVVEKAAAIARTKRREAAKEMGRIYREEEFTSNAVSVAAVDWDADA